jgi:hypothetical protein
MSKAQAISETELEALDRFDREGGLRAMPTPQVHYDHPKCPHPRCEQRLKWIDFKLELHRDPERIYKPLVRAWWEGAGFSGGRLACQNWIRFTTLRMPPLDERDSFRTP